MYCKNCGKIIADDAVFCSYCGCTQETGSPFTEKATASFETDYENTKMGDEPHGYILKSLYPGEELIMQVHIHVIRVLHWFLLAAASIIAAILTAGQGAGLIVLFIILAIVFISIAIIKIKTTELGFTNKRIIGKTGLLWTSSIDSPLLQINNVLFTNGPIGKIFGFGNLLITTASGKFDFSGISHAKEFRTALMHQIYRYDNNIHSR